MIFVSGTDHAGVTVIAVDTYWLAQRGGFVVSQIRCGDNIHSPLIMENNADLVLGMEVHKAMRGIGSALKKGGTLVYMDVSWQPLLVRLGQDNEITPKDIQIGCRATQATAVKVDIRSMEDSRMQNMALLGTVAKHRLVPGVSKKNYDTALEDLLAGEMLKKTKRFLIRTHFEKLLRSVSL